MLPKTRVDKLQGVFMEMQRCPVVGLYKYDRRKKIGNKYVVQCCAKKANGLLLPLCWNKVRFLFLNEILQRPIFTLIFFCW